MSKYYSADKVKLIINEMFEKANEFSHSNFKLGYIRALKKIDEKISNCEAEDVIPIKTVVEKEYEREWGSKNMCKYCTRDAYNCWCTEEKLMEAIEKMVRSWKDGNE